MITYGPGKKKKVKDGSEWPLREKQELVAKHYCPLLLSAEVPNSIALLLSRCSRNFILVF
jgi:hypothetical protein